MAENEIEIILTAIDNASKTIDSVNDSLGGTGGKSGFTGVANEAVQSADSLSDAFARMTKEELMQMNTAKLSGSALSEWEKAVHNANQKARDFASTLPKTTLNIGGFTIATTAAVAAGSALAVALGAAASAFIVFGSANEYSNTVLANTADYTEENIKLAVEYKGHIDQIEGSVNRLKQAVLAGKNSWGEYFTEVSNGIFNLIESKFGTLEGFNLPDKIEAIGTAALKTKDDIFELTDEMKKLYGRASEVNYVIGFTEKKLGDLAVQAAITKAASDGIFTQTEIDFIYGIADALDVQTREMIDAGIAAWNFQQTMLQIMDLPPEIQKRFILYVDIYGWQAAQAAMQGMGSIQPQKVIPQPTKPIATRPVTEMRAGGGYVQKGGWAIVGDAPSGHTTPYTETIHALPGGGVQVFNQSQKSIPAMAGGGMLMPSQNEVTLSFRTIQDLADALAYKMAQVQ